MNLKFHDIWSIMFSELRSIALNRVYKGTRRGLGISLHTILEKMYGVTKFYTGGQVI